MAARQWGYRLPRPLELQSGCGVLHERRAVVSLDPLGDASAGAGVPQELRDLLHRHVGFGIAFYARAQNPTLKRFATAASKALHHNELRVPHFLTELETQVEIDSELARLRASDAIATTTPAMTVRVPGPQLKASSPDAARESQIDGLPPLLAEIVEALVHGPQTRSVLNVIARRGHLQIAGALEVLNE